MSAGCQLGATRSSCCCCFSTFSGRKKNRNRCRLKFILGFLLGYFYVFFLLFFGGTFHFNKSNSNTHTETGNKSSLAFGQESALLLPGDSDKYLSFDS